MWTLCSVAPLSHTGSSAGIFKDIFMCIKPTSYKQHSIRNLHLRPVNELLAQVTPVHLFTFFFFKQNVCFPAVRVMAGCKHKVNSTAFRRTCRLIAFIIVRGCSCANWLLDIIPLDMCKHAEDRHLLLWWWWRWWFESRAGKASDSRPRFFWHSMLSFTAFKS